MGPISKEALAGSQEPQYLKEKQAIRNRENSTQASDQTMLLSGEAEKEQFQLAIPELHLKSGNMIAIIGEVGSGKSTLLHAIIGEMVSTNTETSKQPHIQIAGEVGYVSQRPWIQNLTLKDNILFGRRYDEAKYKDCIRYACLEEDISQLQYGDQTMIGEKGITLSGGQKTRVALARVLYSECNILLLDDVLSAVDVQVGSFIVHECLMKFRKNATRILVTHAINYLQFMDYILVMENGHVAEQGPYEKIMKMPKFNQIYMNYLRSSQEKHKAPALPGQNSSEPRAIPQIQRNLQGLSPVRSELSQSLSQAHNQPSGSGMDKLMIEEDRRRGNIPWPVYQHFLAFNGGLRYTLLLLLTMTCFQICLVMSSIYLQIWTTNADQTANTYYLKYYAIISLNVSTFLVLRIALVFSSNLKMIHKLHQKMSAALLYAPINKFFDRIPIGRILNRLSKDLTQMDTRMLYGIGNFTVNLFQLFGNIVITIYLTSFWVIIPIIIVLFVFYRFQKYYMQPQREVIRLSGISKSPIVAFFQETLSGLPVIRAFRQTERFFFLHTRNVDENLKNQIMSVSLNSFFGLFLSILSIVINAAAIVFCLFSENSTPSDIGLLITSALSFDKTISRLILRYSELEGLLVQFERCLTYTQIEPEPGYRSQLAKRASLKKLRLNPQKQFQMSDWPSKGEIEFKDVSVKYQEDQKCVLTDLSFKIGSREKVGIVGRTGAGKSTITLCILRFLELVRGNICIDGIDIAKISLGELRNKITIIQQDPQLLHGTIRHNIDPQEEFSPSQVKEAIALCGLGHLIESRDGLNTTINEGGNNLSFGEKQLICIARALLKKSKIILIDEATANIDNETEQLIQSTFTKVFKDCTVLTIAHRINTIMSSDRILLVNNGKIEDFGTPQELLSKQNSTSYNLFVEAQQSNSSN